MSYKVLARKWRPKNFADVVGQIPTLQVLRYALEQNKLHHAYLFTGTRGIGKTTIARILAKCLSCDKGITTDPCGKCFACESIDEGHYADVLEIDAASKTKVEDTRELLENIAYLPTSGRFKIYIIDEVHMLSTHSFNALLKTLEEPPEHVKFLLATTDPQKLPITVLSRCLQFQLCRFSAQEIISRLEYVLNVEKIPFEIQAIKKIALVADGSMRDALTLLEQIIAINEDKIAESSVLQILGIAHNTILINLLDAIIHVQADIMLSIIEKLHMQAVDFNKVLIELQVILHKLAMIQINPNYLEEDAEEKQLLNLAKQIPPEEIQLLYQIALNGRKDLPYAPDIRLGFEMILLRMLSFQPINVAIYNKQIPKPKTLTQTPPITMNREIPEWPDLIKKLKLSGLAKVVADYCVVKSWENDRIILILDKAHKASLKDRHTTQIKHALEKYLNHPVKLDIQVGAVMEGSYTERLQSVKENSQKEAEENINSDNIIQNLKEAFNAKIEEISVKEEV